MQTKKLELLLLAGCSCLLTLLCQPIAAAVTASSTTPSTVMQTSAHLESASCKSNFQSKLTNAKRNRD
ncbi:MAG: hypothetical protein HC780_00820 [Leptolyngbyaceae cyanobacterium CSU_1_3]|nr:hypothetical protein [Leptolyngbyaceae cyanobacterium CSU_1_3]